MAQFATPDFSNSNYTSTPPDTNSTDVKSFADLIKKNHEEAVKQKRLQKQQQAKAAASAGEANAVYDPTQPDLNKTFTMSNKSFSSTNQLHDQRALADLPVYQTKSFVNPTADAVNIKKADIGGNSGDSSPFNKTFSTTSSIYSTKGAYQTNSRFETTPSFNLPKPVDQSKTFATKTAPGFDKTYDGPMPALARKTSKTNAFLTVNDVAKFPDHPLSVDEVKSLLNHGSPLPDDIPMDDDAPSKPLNSTAPGPKPAYTPDPSHNPYESNFEAVDPSTRQSGSVAPSEKLPQ